MENSSLNVSHRYARQAIKCFRSAKFEEAINCHEMAKKKIDEAIQNCSMPRVLESLRLQKQFHNKQIDLALIRREQHEKILAAESAVEKGHQLRNNLEDSRQVQLELYQSLDNAEKVVEVLEQKTLTTGQHKEAESSEFLQQLFEDLKSLNEKSNALVHQLVKQLDARIAENDDLREALLSRDGEGSKGPQSRTSSLEKKNNRALSDSDQDLASNLEELPPLELPTFDFNTFSSLSTGLTSSKEETESPEATTKDNDDDDTN